MDDNMINCPKCGHDNASSSEECDNCGVTLSLVLGNTLKTQSKPKPKPAPKPEPAPGPNLDNLKECPKCGSDVPESSMECIKCGIIFSKYFEVQERKLRETLSDLDRSVLEETSGGEEDLKATAEKDKIQAELEKAEAERRKIEEQEKIEVERRKAKEAEEARLAAEEAERLKRQQEEAAKAEAKEQEKATKEKAEKERAEKEKAEQEEKAPPAGQPAEKPSKEAPDQESLQRIAQLEKEAETLRLQTAALQKEKQDYEKAEIVKKEQQEQERQEVLQKAQEAQQKIAALEEETQALKTETEALKKDKDGLEAEVAQRKEQDEKEAEQRRQAEKEEQEKAEALEEERRDAKKRIQTILKTVLPKPTMKELLKKYEGEAVGINFDDPAEIKSARLASVNEDHFSIMVPENELVHSYPYSHIVSIVEGADGVPIDASGETPTYPVVIRVYHLNVKKKWGFI
jgi:DNA repair exonuclease SbcCD ATPase subunit